MVSPAENRPRVPESMGTGNLMWVHPAELMRDNPAALVVNSESYNRIVASFSIEQFDPPQVVRVRIYSSEGEEVVRIFVVDGHTRTKYASDHPDVIVQHFRFEAIPVRDVTVAAIRSPIIVPQNERRPDQEALTMIQYLRAVIPPTIEHSQIAPDRIATHLVNGWRNMVGNNLAMKFSAIAALSFLENPDVPTATDGLLTQFLRNQSEIMAGETEEERVRLQQALLEMMSIVRQTKLFKEKITESAFVLVASGSPVIGGERESLHQIYGLLHTPMVEQKLATASTYAGERERLRTQLGQLIADTFKRFSEAPNKEQVITVLGQVLKDPALNLDQVNEVFNSDLPVERYNQIRQGINRGKLETAYLATSQGKNLSEIENMFVDNLGKRTYLTGRDLQLAVRAIKDAVDAVEKLDQYLEKLVNDREEFLKSGLTSETISDAVDNLGQMRNLLLTATSPQSVSSRAKDLKDVISGTERKITRQINIQQLGQMIDEVYGEELKSGFGPQVRGNIISYLLREVDISDKSLVKRILSQIKGFDSDIQSRVITGDIRLAAATRIQSDRKTKPTAGSKVGQETRTAGPAIGRAAPAEEVRDEQQSKGVDQIDRMAIMERRKRVNNATLRRGLESIKEALANLDIDPSEITLENSREIEDVLNKLGQLNFNHPDIVRVVRDYLSQLQSGIKASEVQVQQDVEDAQKDARTRI